jgi:hypothetical protein
VLVGIFQTNLHWNYADALKDARSLYAKNFPDLRSEFGLAEGI